MIGISRLVLASNNQGKLREFNALLSPLSIEVVPQSSLGVPEIDEPYETFLENALHKARHAAKHTGLPSLADDSGICVPALGGMPGVYSARFAGEPKSDDRNNEKLCQALSNQTDRSAFYYCVLVMVRHERDPQPVIADGVWHGRYLDTPSGHGGFGYDPYFYLPDLGLTVAELESSVKNDISHRAKALHALIEKLR